MNIQDIKQNVEVKMTKEENLGRCYNRYYYTITSTIPLTDQHFKLMWNNGMIGWGQFWGFDNSVSDQPETFYDGNGKPSYIYKTYSTVDSSD